MPHDNVEYVFTEGVGVGGNGRRASVDKCSPLGVRDRAPDN